MFSSSRALLAAAAALLVAAMLLPAGGTVAQDKDALPKQPGIAFPPQPLGLGRPATKEEIKGWDIAVRPDGHGLPAGKGSVKDGETLYQERCAACHGEFGEGKDRWPALIG